MFTRRSIIEAETASKPQWKLDHSVGKFFISLILFSLLALSVSFSAQSQGNIIPCKFCILQQASYSLILTVAILGLVGNKKRVLFALRSVLIIAAFIAGYHTLIQFGLIKDPCITHSPIPSEQFAQILLENIPTTVASCSKQSWTVFNLPISLYNLMSYLFLFFSSYRLTRSPLMIKQKLVEKLILHLGATWPFLYHLFDKKIIKYCFLDHIPYASQNNSSSLSWKTSISYVCENTWKEPIVLHISCESADPNDARLQAYLVGSSYFDRAPWNEDIDASPVIYDESKKRHVMKVTVPPKSILRIDYFSSMSSHPFTRSASNLKIETPDDSVYFKQFDPRNTKAAKYLLWSKKILFSLFALTLTLVCLCYKFVTIFGWPSTKPTTTQLTSQ